MRKELQIATALAALLAAPVLAQNTPPAAPSTGEQPTAPMPTTPRAPPPAPTAAAPDSTGAAAELRYRHGGADAWQAVREPAADSPS